MCVSCIYKCIYIILSFLFLLLLLLLNNTFPFDILHISNQFFKKKEAFILYFLAILFSIKLMHLINMRDFLTHSLCFLICMQNSTKTKSAESLSKILFCFAYHSLLFFFNKKKKKCFWFISDDSCLISVLSGDCQVFLDFFFQLMSNHIDSSLPFGLLFLLLSQIYLFMA